MWPWKLKSTSSKLTFFYIILYSDGRWREVLDLLSTIMLTGFMFKHTAWNSLGHLFGSSPTKPLKIGNKWISPDLTAKSTSKFVYMILHGFYFNLLTTSSLSVWPTTFISSFSSSRSLERVYYIVFSYNGSNGLLDLNLKECTCCIQWYHNNQELEKLVKLNQNKLKS